MKQAVVVAALCSSLVALATVQAAPSATKGLAPIQQQQLPSGKISPPKAEPLSHELKKPKSELPFLDVEQQTQQVHYEQLPELAEIRQQQEVDRSSIKSASLVRSGVAPVAEYEGYSFAYATDSQSRQETGDARGVVRGQYTVRGLDGSGRVVDYIADEGGFRAVVSTDEHGTASRSPANVVVRSFAAEARAPEALGTKTRPLEQQQEEIMQETGATKHLAPVVSRHGFESASSHRELVAPVAAERVKAASLVRPSSPSQRVRERSSNGEIRTSLYGSQDLSARSFHDQDEDDK